MVKASQQALSGDDFAARTARAYREKFPGSDDAAMAASLAVGRADSAQKAAFGRFFESLESVRSARAVRSSGRYTLLRILYFAPGRRLTQIEIVNEMEVTSPNVTYLIDALEKEGLVARSPHPTDRRLTFVELTPAGVATCDVLVPAMVDFIALLLRGLSEEEKRQLYEFVDRLRRNAEAYDPEAK